MSSDVPGSGAGGPDAGGPTRTDYLDDGAPQSSSRRRWPLVAGGAAVAVALVGAAAWGVSSFLSDGTSPAQGVPASALGFIAIDIDPGKGQQLEAYRTLKKFPALQEELGLDEDLRKTLFDAIKEESGCEDLDFAEDVEPWLGNSIAFAALPGDEEPMPFGVVEVTDQDAAAAGVETLAECGEGGEDPVYAFSGDFMVIAETQDDADRVVDEIDAEGPLADDGTYQDRVDEAGGAGFVTGYAAPEASEAFLEEALSSPDVLAGSSDPLTADADNPFAEPATESGPTEEQEEMIRDVFADFEGAAMSMRFEDEGLELNATAAGITTDGLSEAFQGGDSGVTELPATTIAAYAIPIGDDLVQAYLDFAEKFMDEDELEQGISEFETETGLSVPEDVQTILGDGIAFSVDSSADWSGTFNGTSDPTEFPAGIRIVGDPEEVVPLVEQALAAAEAPPGAVTIEEGDGVVAIGFSPEYAEELAGSGDLGSQAGFESVFPDLGEDEGLFYVSFEGDWLADLLEGFPGAEQGDVRENIEPLQAVGAAGSADDEGFSYTVRVTTD
jgi:hypothetical protein